MLHLPRRTSISAVKSFMIVLSTITVTLLSILYLYVVPSPYILIAGVVCISSLVPIAYRKPMIMWKCYTQFNTFYKQFLIPMTQKWILAVIYFLIVFGNHLQRVSWRSRETGAANTMWYPKKISNVIGGSGSEDVVVDEDVRDGWLRKYYRWTNATGNFWLISLIPFMILLNLLEEQPNKTEGPTDSYRLY